MPTDPGKSESGGIFAVYLTSMLAGGDVPNMAAAQQAMPQVQAYFDSLGYLEPSTGQLFARFLKAGQGDKPVIAAYESQGIEAIKQYPDAAKILEKLRIIYPRPTVWISHPLIALTDGGKALIQALNDKEIQDIAWKKHGFRSGVAGVTNDPAELAARESAGRDQVDAGPAAAGSDGLDCGAVEPVNAGDGSAGETRA